MLLFLMGLIVFTVIAIGMGISFMDNSNFRIFRVLFPSWRFFEDITPIPKVYYRIQQNGFVYTPWIELQFSPGPRKFSHLFHNPDENLRITYQVQIEQLLNDIAIAQSDAEGFIPQLASYKIIFALIRLQILDRHPEGFESFQFKIGALEFTTSEFGKEPLWNESILSAELEA